MQTQATEAAGQPAQTHTTEAINALVNRAKTALLFAGMVGKADNMRFWQGYLAFAKALTKGAGQFLANRDASLSGGYQAPTCFQAAWAAFSSDAKSLSLAEMQQFLALQGVEVATDPVTSLKVDDVAQMEDGEFTIVDPNNEQTALVVDVVDSALHAPSVVDAATVANAKVPAQQPTTLPLIGQPWLDQGGIFSTLAIDALEKRAKKCLLIAAMLGKAENMRFWAGSLAATQSLKSGMAQKMADFDVLRSGYHIPTSFQAAWAAFPDNAKNLTLAQMQEFLRLQGVQITTDPVTDGELNGVEQLEHDKFTVVSLNNEQPTLSIDGVDSALHAPSVVDAATVAQAEVPA